MTFVRDELGRLVVSVERTPTGITARFWLMGLEFDLTDTLRIYRSSPDVLLYCHDAVRKQIKRYCESDDVMQRRAGHMLWPTPSAPLHRSVGATIHQTLTCYRQYER